MKVTCEKLLLLNAITISSRASLSKSPIPLLEGLLLEADDDNMKITGYDLKTGIITNIPAEVEKQGGIVLSARLFVDIIRKMPGQYITISVDTGFVANISSEMSDFDIIGLPTIDYPELPIVEEKDSFEIEESVLKKMISQTNFAVSDNDSRPIHTGALFEKVGDNLTIVAVDGYRLALRKEALKESGDKDLNFVVPGSALGEVERILSDNDKNIVIYLGAKHIMFKMDETFLISRRLEGEFLNYKNSISQQSKYKISVEKDELISAVERVSLIISDKLKSPVRCVFEEGIVKLHSSSTVGKASDECLIKGSGEDLEIGFNDRYLLEALKAAPADEIIVELNTPTTPCIITPFDEKENFLYMILPVRLRANES